MSTVPSIWQRFLLASLSFVFVFGLGYAADLLTVRHPSWMFLDDLILGIIAALIVFRYERERSRFLSEKVRVIREMNAFVRNELQLLYVSLTSSEKARVHAVERGVERIDWALRELLPGDRKSGVSAATQSDELQTKAARSV